MVSELRRQTKPTVLTVADYVAGNGSLRTLAARHSVSDSTLMKRAAREHWAAQARLHSRELEARVTATMQQRAEAFVDRMADQTDNFLGEGGRVWRRLGVERPAGLKQLTSALKDVSAVGRETYGLSRDDGKAQCIVNLGFLGDYVPERVVGPPLQH